LTFIDAYAIMPRWTSINIDGYASTEMVRDRTSRRIEGALMVVQETESRRAPAQCCVPLASEEMTLDDAAATASLFKALGDPPRVRIVNLLATAAEAVCVCDLTEFLGLSQPTVSHHMRKLVDAGLLAREQRWVWAYYSLRDDAIRRLGGVLRFEEGVA
jgi:ArsR family transcriptional regulator